MENTRPGNHDKAWNDPPLFDYKNTPNAGATGSSGGSKLNKRIGFPSTLRGPAANTGEGDRQISLNDAGAKPLMEAGMIFPKCCVSKHFFRSLQTCFKFFIPMKTGRCL